MLLLSIGAQVAEKDHNIGFQNIPPIFRRKMTTIAENSDNKIDPCNLPTTIVE
jgi:hypothetical protein